MTGLLTLRRYVFALCERRSGAIRIVIDKRRSLYARKYSQIDDFLPANNREFAQATLSKDCRIICLHGRCCERYHQPCSCTLYCIGSSKSPQIYKSSLLKSVDLGRHPLEDFDRASWTLSRSDAVQQIRGRWQVSHSLLKLVFVFISYVVTCF